VTELTAVCLQVIKDLHHRHRGLLQDDKRCPGAYEVVLKKDRQDTKRTRSLAGDQSQKDEKKAKTFSILLLTYCYGHIAYNKLFSSKFDIWAHRSGFGEIPWTPSAHKLDHCTYLCTGRDSWSFARDTIILARHRHPHHHLVNIKQIWGAVFIILFIISLVASLFRR